eukprot:1194455-Prorocentrum_minimum.AAC.3
MPTCTAGWRLGQWDVCGENRPLEPAKGAQPRRGERWKDFKVQTGSTSAALMPRCYIGAWLGRGGETPRPAPLSSARGRESGSVIGGGSPARASGGGHHHHHRRGSPETRGGRRPRGGPGMPAGCCSRLLRRGGRCSRRRRRHRGGRRSRRRSGAGSGCAR